MFETLAYYITVFYRSFAGYTSGQLQKLGLHFGSLFLVLYVGKHPGCSQAQLTAALGLDWGYSQRSITRLVEQGFLTRVKAGRAYRLGLSEKGKEAFSLSHQVFLDWDETALSALTAAERQQLFALLGKLNARQENAECMKPLQAP
ncbi:MAG: MarR family winged helix-turn-helix transcriptional regulator [Pygmaiobacter massiliensis]|nr:MarR family winged helix-turn-helix transcriptional regulator [Pygmaiobacter massiliensis]